MIRRLSVTDRDKIPVSWWMESKFTRDIADLEFQPGVNILFGPNGSGKSTLLRLLSRLTFCDGSGVPKITRDSVGHFFDRGQVLDGSYAETNGEPTLLLDPSAGVAVKDGYFGYENMENLGMWMQARKSSSGQVAQMKIVSLIKSLEDKELKVEWKVAHNAVNDIWKRRLDYVAQLLKPFESCDKKGRTVLMDEPFRSMDLPTSLMAWRGLLRRLTGIQLIIATHFPFALDINANFIETEDGYIDKCRSMMLQWDSGYAAMPGVT